MKNSTKPDNFYKRAYNEAHAQFMNDLGTEGVTLNDVAFFAMILAIAALLYAFASGSSVVDLVVAGAIGLVALAGVLVTKVRPTTPGDMDANDASLK